MERDRYKYFRIEAAELIARIKTACVELGSGRGTREVLRATHTLKGAAGVVGLLEVARAAHGIESALAPFRDGGAVSPVALGQLREHLDVIERGCAALRSGDSGVPAVHSSPAQTRAAQALSSGTDEASATAVGRAVPASDTTVAPDAASDFEEDDGIEVAGQPDALAVSATGLDVVARSVTELSARLDVLAGALSAASTAADAAALSPKVAALRRQASSLSASVSALRMTPASALFGDLAMAAPAWAAQASKQVRFRSVGGGQPLDARAVAGLRQALLHLLSNAIAHGIEAPAERVAAGKDPTGSIVCTVSRKAGVLKIELRDDGRGVAMDEVRERAQAQGLWRGTAKPTDDETLQLLFSDGLSTRTKVDRVAGRGIGLNAVREGLRVLRGTVQVTSKAGRGTAVTLTIPVQLAAHDVLLVGPAGAEVALPFMAVRNVVRFTASDLVADGAGSAIVYGDAVIPFCWLDSAMGDRNQATAGAAVVLASEGDRAAIGVTRIGKTKTVTIVPLPRCFGTSPIIAGAWVDPTGRPRLMLRPDGLIASAKRASTRPLAAAVEVVRRVLVIDDSMTSRMLEQTVLEGHGFETDAANSAEQALEMLEEGRYALFLCDVEMPGMDGYGFTRTVTTDPRFEAVPVVLMTTRDAPEDIQRGMEAGASAYLIKSEFDEARLVETIEGLIG